MDGEVPSQVMNYFFFGGKEGKGIKLVLIWPKKKIIDGIPNVYPAELCCWEYPCWVAAGGLWNWAWERFRAAGATEIIDVCDLQPQVSLF